MGNTGNYEELLRQICEEIRPRKILEFGSGESSKIFAEYGHVTCFEYDPPGNWDDVKSDSVQFIFVPRETEPSPRNLVHAMFGYLSSQMRSEVDYDLTRNTRLRQGDDSIPLWDLAYVDGAVHMENFGWCGGDLSYVTRTMVAGLLLPFARFVVIDDIPFLPMLGTFEKRTLGRFCILDTRSVQRVVAAKGETT